MTIRAMTYNLKFPGQDPPHAWSSRRGLLAEVLRRSAPQIVGTQEGHFFQLREIVADARGRYEWIGLGRRGGSHGEFNAILFDPRVAEPLEFDHFWLSQTPELVGSRSGSWGNTSVRMATWVRFAVPGGELLWLNTHLDHDHERARVEGARLIASRLMTFGPRVPIVVSGDFNCVAGRSAAFEVLTSGTGLSDAWSTAGGPEISTYAGWQPPRPGGRIDWLLVRGLSVDSVGSCDYHVGARWPSDHVPVYADLRMP